MWSWELEMGHRARELELAYGAGVESLDLELGTRARAGVGNIELEC